MLMLHSHSEGGGPLFTCYSVLLREEAHYLPSLGLSSMRTVDLLPRLD